MFFFTNIYPCITAHSSSRGLLSNSRWPPQRGLHWAHWTQDNSCLSPDPSSPALFCPPFAQAPYYRFKCNDKTLHRGCNQEVTEQII